MGPAHGNLCGLSNSSASDPTKGCWGLLVVVSSALPSQGHFEFYQTSREKKNKNGDGFEHPSPTGEGLTSSHPPLVPRVPPARPKGCSPGRHRVPSVAQARFGDNTRPGWESFGHRGRSSGGGLTHGPVALPGLLTCRRCQDWGRTLLQPQEQSQDPSGVRGCWISQ